MAKRTVEVGLDPEMYEQIKARAKARGVSANEWMRLALAASLSGRTSVAITTTTTIHREL